MDVILLPQSLLTKTTNRWLAAVGAATLLCGSGVVAYFNPSEVHFFPVCPLYALTGFACPGCGLTRGFHALFHGDILTALHFNALIPIWTVIFGAVFVSLVLFGVRGKGLPFSKISPNWLLGLMVVLMVFGVVRNLPFYPFTLLFP
jgi:hypothetical protein